MLEIPAPVPRARDVLVRVFASSINIDDIHVAERTFYGGIPIAPSPRPGRPFVPGTDVAGIVVAVGENVRSIRPGDAVFGVQIPFRSCGAWAELCAIDERWVTRKPEAVSFAAAAASGVSGLVALSAIRALKLQRGQRLIVVGATGGIGAIAVQLARRAGVEVIGICGTRNVERAYALGCTRVLDYRRTRWDQALSGDIPVDRVLDLIGGSDVQQMARRVLRRDGRFVTVVGPERFIGDRHLGRLGILRILAQVGYAYIWSRIRGPRYILTGPGLRAGRELAEVAAVLSVGILPLIDSEVPFELTAMRPALKRAAAHQNNGRIVISMETAA